MKEHADFDPYGSWLGIPPQEQPPDHYRLLGVKRFEQDLAVIKTHADQRIRQVNMYRRSAHGSYCDEVLHRINTAKACLLNPMLKSSYDRKLESELAGAKPSTPKASAGDGAMRPKAESPKRTQQHKPADKAVEVPSPMDELPDLSTHAFSLDSLLGPAPAPASKAPSSPSSPPKETKDDPDLDLALDSDNLNALFAAFEDPKDQSRPLKQPDRPESPKAKRTEKKAKSRDQTPLAQAPVPTDMPSQIVPMPEEPAPPVHRESVAPSEGSKAKRSRGQPAPGKAARPAMSVIAELPANPGYEVLAPNDPVERAATAPADGEVSLDEPRTSPRPASRRIGLLLGAAIACMLLVGTVLVWNVVGANSSSFRQPITRAELDRVAVNNRPHPMTTGSVNAPPSSSSAPSTQPIASEPPPQAGDKTPAAEESNTTIPVDKSDRPIEIGIAYGTEKRKWLECAVERFATTDEGWHVRVNLIPMGSLESAHAILDGDKRIHVWSPASSLYRDTLVRDWQAKHQGNPILKEEALALTPMVIAMWKGRCDAYAARCPELSLRTFRYAMELETGWDRIAQKPQWGRFKFGHTHPNQSNSGLMTLVVMAYEFHKKTSGLTVSDIMSPKFQEFLTHFERGVSKLSNSTGNLMREMVLKGPASLDAILVYESVAIDYMESAEGRWDRLQVIYPKCNLWNENPYYILNTPWTTPAHQKAAEALLRFLMNTWVQGQALQHGFRPGNPKVPVKGLESPFVRYARTGLSVELPEVCEPPSPEVIDNLLQSWIRNAPTR